MKNETIIYAFCYELALWAIQRFPRFRRWLLLALDYCRPFWAEWKTQATLKAVDKQTKALVEQWDREEKESRSQALADRAQELFPDATITPLPDAVVPSVMIVREAAPDASEEVRALGGELRITYKLD